MNFLDIILICAVTLFILRGFFRGLVQEVLSLVAVVLAIVLASNFHGVISPHLKMYIESDITVGALSYAVIFFGTLLVFWLLTKLLRSVLEVSLLGWIDRTAGGLFGLFEGVLICLVVLLFLQTFAPDSDILNQSFFAPRAKELLDWLGQYIDMPSPQAALDSARSVLGIKNGSAE